jgi:hypothetical protein
MELNQEERRVLAVLDETPVRNPVPNPTTQIGEMTVPLATTIDKLLTLGYIKTAENPPRSGEHWYLFTSKVPR